MTALTSKGITYMHPSDNLAQVASIMQTLAQDVNSLLPWHGTGLVSGTTHAAGGLITVNVAHGLAFTPTRAFAEISGFVTNSAGIILKGVTAMSSTNLTVTLLNTAGAAATYSNLPIRWQAYP